LRWQAMRQYYRLMPAEGEQGGGERPDYKVYRSRPGFLSRLRSPSVEGLRERMRRQRKTGPRRGKPGPSPGGRPWWHWVLFAIGGWILLSFVTFAISAQIQKSKLQDSAGSVLGGNPFLTVDPQTILVLGTDIRSADFASEAETQPENCVDAASRGDTPPSSCLPYRADTIMLVRAGGGVFRKLSIPRDTYAAIPGVDSEKINAAYANGGAKLQVQTVEQFLGIDIDQVAIVDFGGFRDFIDAVGGIEVDLPTSVCSEISGGAANGGITLNLKQGENTLNGNTALALARTRENSCGPSSDLERAKYQQLILSGIKGRLTSPLRLPYNFIKGPIIGWTAPKTTVSSMGALTMPQLPLASAVGGDSDPAILKPSGPGPLGSLLVPVSECQQAVEKLLGGPPPRTPACSPTG
jgi:LCP family protein required for cell wall assembly